jgi:hypothetical protein
MEISFNTHLNIDGTEVLAKFFFVVVAKPSRTPPLHEINSEPDRCGILYLCQEHSTNKFSKIIWSRM